MAGVDVENRGKQTSKLKKDFIERFAKFKESKQKKAPLQDRRRNENISGNKRKSHPVSTTKVPFKKSRDNVAVITPGIKPAQKLDVKPTKKPDLRVSSRTPKSTSRASGQHGTTSKDKTTTSTSEKGTVSPNMAKKKLETCTPSVNNNAASKEDQTPMLERLQKWKEQKKLAEEETSKDRKTELPGKTLHKPGQRQSMIAPKVASTQRVRLTSQRMPGQVGSANKVSKGNRLSRGSAVKTRDVSASTGQKPNLPSQCAATNKGVAKANMVAGPQASVNNNNNHARLRHAVSKKTEVKRPVVKRRHSEVQSRNSPQKKRPGILKRKSCIARFEDTVQPAQIDKETLALDELVRLSPSGERVGQTTVGKTPDTCRTVRFRSPQWQNSDTTYRKTPCNLQMTKEESMRNKLNDWLKAKGKTPSKFRHLMCFDAKMSESKKSDPKTKRNLTVEELTEQQETMQREDNLAVNLTEKFDSVADEEENQPTVDQSAVEDAALGQLKTILDECTILFEAGCPHTDILKWLDSIEQNLPLAKRSATFYICKARVLQSTADLDEVLSVFEQAVVNNAQPAKELATALTAIVKEVSAEREKKAHQNGLKKRVQEENIFESTSIKYCVRQVTPFKKRGRKSTDGTPKESQCTVVTPVRRSTRRSLAYLPDTLHEKTPVFSCLEDLSEADKKQTVYQTNEALEPIMLQFTDSD